MCVFVCVCVLVYQCEDLLQGVLDKWRCHMVRPDVLVSYVHSSSKTTTSATIGPLLSGKASQPICFLPARPSAFWVLAISLVHFQFSACFVSDESGGISNSALAVPRLQNCGSCVTMYSVYYKVAQFLMYQQPQNAGVSAAQRCILIIEH